MQGMYGRLTCSGRCRAPSPVQGKIRQDQSGLATFPVTYGCIDRFEVMVFCQHNSIGFQHQCITVVAVSLGERPVDGDGLATTFQR